MTSLLRVMLASAAAVALLSPGSATPPSFDGLVRQRILPQTGALFRQLVKDKRALTIDGTPVFNLSLIHI